MSESDLVSLKTSTSDQVITQAEPHAGNLADGRKRLPINILSNIAWLAINVGVTFFYTPYLITNLGVAVYGLVPLTTSITNYLSLLTDGFDAAVSRFLQIEIARNDTQAANRIFNTAVAGGLAIFSIILPIAFTMSVLAPQIFNIPPGAENAAQWLVLLTMVSFGITFVSGSFGVSSYASHRFDLRLGVNVTRIAVQIGLVVLLFTVLQPQLWIVSIGIVSSALVYLIGHFTLNRYLTPQLKINPRLFNFSRLKQLLKYSGWVLVNQAGSQLFINIDLIVANLVFGAHTAGRYGAVILFSSYLRAMVGNISSVLEPIVFALYAQNRLTELVRLNRLSVKFLGLAIALPIGLISGLARPLLTLWLGPEFADLSWLVVILVSHLSVNLAVIPLFAIQEATNHVRVPGILTLVMGITNTCLAVAFALWGGFGYLGIAMAGAIVLTAKNMLFTPIYAAKILNLPWKTFITSLINGFMGFLAVALAAYAVATYLPLTGWVQLGAAAAVVSLIYVVFTYFVGLGADERHLLTTGLLNQLKMR